jgi:putative NADH-flavin reductase
MVRHCVNIDQLQIDQLLVDATGQSKISVQDYAIAMSDELERPTHVRQRFAEG